MTGASLPAADSLNNATFGLNNYVPSLSPGKVGDLLSTYRKRQDNEDLTRDAADLRRAMQTALHTDSDNTMIEILQVTHDDIPEAVKMLQRALEREFLGEQDAGQATTENGKITSGKSVSLCLLAGSNRSSTSKDTLFRKFLESGIEALTRMGEGIGLLPPPWTITKWEVDCDEKIGIGSSDVYRGTWGGMAVAIRMLAPTTPRNFFNNEVSNWQRLSHPNVLKIFGASSASRFLVSPYMRHGCLVKYLESIGPHSQLNRLKMVYEVGMGMEYLHNRGVLHGNLKVGECARISVD